MAPEALKRGVYTSKSDVYSFGVMIYEIYSAGGEPFEEVQSIKELVKMKKENRATLKIQGDVQPEVQEVFNKCLLFDPEDRPSFEQLEAMVKELPGIIHPSPPSVVARLLARLRKLLARN